MSTNVVWDDLRIFLAVLEEGSLSAAGRRLGLSHPTVRSRILALEYSLNTVLFTRSVNGLTPTETAETLRAPARSMAQGLDFFIRQASVPAGAIAGRVRVSVPECMGITAMPAILDRVRQTHPNITIELALHSALANVQPQGIDITVRNFAPTPEDLIARKVSDTSFGLFAAPGYISRRGMPTSLEQLAAHDTIGPNHSHTSPLVQRLDPAFTQLNHVLRTDSPPAQLSAARAGMGIVVAATPVGDNDPALVRILPDFHAAVLETWIVIHEDLIHVPKVRAVFDALVEGFRDQA